ncbi:alpha-1,3-mannosyl-glycoprotein 4-beta-N-acetylglucosaminyltransferase B-like isoform X2 [Nilaparvata lugens]|uniref:alpha-1,3-mannosyl-glycoprotein 4-beta-N-acetylglucosaminyltransferase B-like isoform X2 n=2 Tax=Nilaparvata lugens TaxID=108931 RepID=UPI00193DF0D9|nr:alpha-1,3-mannosyl-glycoprotein 4-beta-N-acetylglucosaminyltransferase B-like isoform X2 [Nilaparvata lugens]XP_039287078.1 alpha-1,3-mannosyl-glycoprotein 4-beta-N-acetylglucosaminyltransferase B-like isoform X2 [Nilaparvata lugens]XP_039287079.1 alpha-1,3-mannosyl-glycoprotein 4-beta-N-acetylglucosaminyltransferase B-like isoform X2 [Nilaparvata lugens]
MNLFRTLCFLPFTHRQQALLCGFLVAFVTCSLITLSSRLDMCQEMVLIQQLHELQTQVIQLNDNYIKKEEELKVLRQHLDRLLNKSSTADLTKIRTSLKTVSQDVTNLNPIKDTLIDSSDTMELSSGYNFSSHPLLSPSSIKPAFIMSKGRTGVSVALGVPTVKRENQTYVLATLQNLLDGMSQEEKDDTIIIVFIAETIKDYILQIANSIKKDFKSHSDSGLIEVISPAASFYPDLSKLDSNIYNDTKDRYRWRTKQNLDYAYLMMYSYSKSKYYVQLEDDILAKPNFITTMIETAQEETARAAESWVLLDFCKLGFIGKLFNSEDLPPFAQFLLKNHTSKPVDWLLQDFISTRVCPLEEDHFQLFCQQKKDQIWIIKTSLFQHVGVQSSLKGKVQNLKDEGFGEIALYFPHRNPGATVMSEVKAFKRYTLDRAYVGETFFWGLVANKGDHLYFKFKVPLIIKRYLFRSGNVEHPSDIFYNTSVEVLPVNHLPKTQNTVADGFVIVGEFNSKGVAEGSLGSQYGLIRELRLTINAVSEHRAILSEIHIQPEKRNE